MQIDERLVDGIAILAISGDLNAHNIPDANERLDAHLKTLRCRLVFNLSGLEIVTSTAIGFLVDAARRTRKLGGDSVVSEPTRLFQKTMDMLQAGKVFKTFPSDNEAVAYLLLGGKKEGS